MINEVTVYLPGLLNLKDLALKHMPSLQQLLKHSKLVDIYAVVSKAVHDLPIASALNRNANTPNCIAEYVHIDLDQSRGYLRAIQYENITSAEQEILDKQMQQWAEQLGVSIKKLDGCLAWHITFSEAQTLGSLQRPDLLIGESIIDKIPHPDNGKVFQWFNEWQMILYAQSDIIKSGINAVWFWGATEEQPAFDGFISDDWYLQQLANKHQLVVSNSYKAKDFASCQSVLMIDYNVKKQLASDEETYFKYLENNIFSPLLKDFKHKKIQQLTLSFSEEQSYQINDSLRKPWWKIF